MSREAILARAYEQGERFLAYPWRRLLWFMYNRSNRKRAWVLERVPGKSE